MSYYNLGNSCISRTMALTSNEKFLLPFDSIYYKHYTKNTLMYPGHEEDSTLYRPLKPNIIDNMIYGARDRFRDRFRDRREKREKDDREERRQCKSC